jgi:predicted aconitase
MKGAFALIGIAALDIAAGGILAEIGNAAIEFASNLASLGARTYRIVKTAEDVCESALDSVKETLQDIENEIDSNLLSNEEVRKWYHQQLEDIPNRINNSLP